MAASIPQYLAQQRGFASTHWTAIRACAGNDTIAFNARGELCRAYWYPVYAYIRRSGQNTEEPEDLTQEFFAYVLSRPWFMRADADKGKFRSFLLGSLDRFLRGRQEHNKALKRGGSYQHVSYDVLNGGHQSSSEEVKVSPATFFEVEWAGVVVAAALQRLTEEYQRTGKADHYRVLKRFMACEGTRESYEGAADDLGITPGNIKVCVSRLRKRYIAALRNEVALTVATPDEVDDEMRHLREVLANSQF